MAALLVVDVQHTTWLDVEAPPRLASAGDAQGETLEADRLTAEAVASDQRRGAWRDSQLFAEPGDVGQGLAELAPSEHRPSFHGGRGLVAPRYTFGDAPHLGLVERRTATRCVLLDERGGNCRGPEAAAPHGTSQGRQGVIAAARDERVS